ncbi:HNH endonuclease [Mycobacterium sp. SMC-4]|uniref:HNH endonuclease n=1 Tax=Mycobacterium sp. SMC-4 TaxID=2857059 RepID=UPI0021FB37A2|nr:HNH endonuclease [Mycobacterium sp. SMC-4]
MCGAAWSTIDHVKPIAAGGAHMLCNLRPMCGSCNPSKGAKWPLEDPLGRHRQAA